jgi:YggT family protein
MTYPPPPDPDVVESGSPPVVYPVRTIPTPYWRAIQTIWFVAGVIDVLVGLRFLLKLLGASTASPFVVLVYGITAALVAPFRGIFPVTGQGAFVFEPASLVALVIYPLIALGLAYLIRIMGRRRVDTA